MVRFITLGGTDLRDTQGSELRAVLVQPRRLALLTCLALAPGSGFLRREHLLALFWPDDKTERARASLNRAVYFLRQNLGDGIVLSRGDDELGLDRLRLWCDAEAFQASLAAGDRRRALELYRGDLMPAYFVTGAPGFDEWLESQRTRLRDLASTAAAELVAAEVAGGDPLAAVHWARRATKLAPFDEVALRRLLKLLDQVGDRAGAVRAYHEFAGDLVTQLGVEPSTETALLTESIRVRPNGIEAGREIIPGRPSGETGHQRATAQGSRRLGVIAAATVLLVAGSVLARPRPIDPLRVEVTRFENRTGDPALDRLGPGGVERVLDGLVRSGVIRRDRNSPAAAGWRVAAGMDSSRSEASPRGEPGTVVSTAWERHGDRVRIRARIIDRRRGGRVWELPADSGPLAGVEAILTRLGPRIAGGVAVLESQYYASLLPLSTVPPTVEAWREFSEGGQFRLAAALDTTFTWPLIHAALAAIQAPFPRGAEADSLLRQLSSVSERLSPLERNLIEYVRAARAGRWEDAYQAIRAAARIAPDQFSYLEAVRAMQLQRPGEALAALKRPGLDRIYQDDAKNYWFMLTTLYHQVGEHRAELVAARRARLRAPANPSLMVQEIRALAALGRIDAVRQRLDSLQSLPRDGWFVPGVGLMQVGSELLAHGHSREARDALDRAIAWYRSRPAVELTGEPARYFLGVSLTLSGQLVAADSVFHGLYREHPDNVDYIGLLGTVAARRGDRAGAHLLAGRLEGREVGASIPGELSLLWRAKIAALLGDATRAMHLLVAAYGPQGTIELHGDPDFDGLKDYPPFQEFIRPKG